MYHYTVTSLILNITHSVLNPVTSAVIKIRSEPYDFLPVFKRWMRYKIRPVRRGLRRFKKPKIVSLPIDDLIFPNRLDIWLRVMFLREYDKDRGLINLSETPYYWFRIDLAGRATWAPNEDESLKIYIAIYESIKAEGYIRSSDRNDYLSVVRTGIKTQGCSYVLYDGAHRLACLKHLGYQTALFRVLDEPFKPPDYTSSILSSNYIKHDKMTAVINDWQKAYKYWEDSIKYG